MSVRGREFPSLVQEAGQGYRLQLLVHGVDGRDVEVCVPPPISIVNEDADIWPPWCFQTMLVVSEYVAALHEFMTWSFPDDWAPLKAQVAAHAAQLIRSSAAVPPPPSPSTAPQHQPGPGQASSLHAYRVWAAFTHCYFSGCRKPPASCRKAPHGAGTAFNSNSSPSSERQEAIRWLSRLVGDRGWQADGPVYSSAARWVDATLERLQSAFPDAAAASASGWAATIAPLRPVATRGVQSTHGRYVPVYPYHMTGTWSENRFKLTVRGVKAPRSVKGSCGVPAAYGQTNNCALGFLMLADVSEAFNAAFEEAAKSLQSALHGQEGLQRQVINGFFNTVLSSDTEPLSADYLAHGNASALAACVLGWRLALEQLPLWLQAAAESAAAARGVTVPPGVPPELLLPREMSLPLPPLPPPPPPPPQQQQPQQLLPLQLPEGKLGQLPHLTFAEDHNYAQLNQQHRHHLQPHCPGWPPQAVPTETIAPAGPLAAPGTSRAVEVAVEGGNHTLPSALPMAAGAFATALANLSGGGGGGVGGGGGGPPSTSPFAMLQQRQGSAVNSALRSFSFASDPRAAQPTPAHGSPLVPAAMGIMSASLSLSPSPPLPPPPPPPVASPHSGGTNGAAAEAADAEAEVTGGLSNMSLDASSVQFGEETLRLIDEEVARGPLPAAAAAAAAGGVSGVATGLAPASVSGTASGLQHMRRLPPGAAVPAQTGLVPTRTITTVLQPPQPSVQAQSPPPAPPPVRAGSAGGTGAAPADVSAAEVEAVALLQAGLEALQRLCGGSLAPRPGGQVLTPRLTRLHEEVAAALEAYRRNHHIHNDQQQHNQHNHRQHQHQQTVGFTAGVGGTAAFNRAHSPSAGPTAVPAQHPPRQPPPPPLPVAPGPFGGAVFVPNPALPVGMFGGAHGLAIPGLTAGVFGAAAAAPAPAPAPAASPQPAVQAASASDAAHERGLQLHSESPGASPGGALLHCEGTGRGAHLPSGTGLKLEQGALTATMNPAGALFPGTGTGTGGGGGAPIRTPSGSLGLASLLMPVEGENSLLGLGQGLELGFGGGPGEGGGASGMSWSHGGGSLGVAEMRPTGGGRGDGAYRAEDAAGDDGVAAVLGPDS